ncbi:hypothetical protein PIB30_099356 [Stylosanthes scabra]|uniref:Non-specific serine/threonine protein kinase n=1 Tax=Stylosanthes scabra TaxID=79078 RepID=A0ABU6UVR5_9FABA|nr:hypothetical protein [Stylosanthes scabra]
MVFSQLSQNQPTTMANLSNLLAPSVTWNTANHSKPILSSIPDDFITECGKIKDLKLLNFSGNNLSGSSPAFHGFAALEYLDMSFNVLESSIDIQFDRMISLKTLNLTHNNFTGHLLTKLGNSMVLE